MNGLVPIFAAIRSGCFSAAASHTATSHQAAFGGAFGLNTLCCLSRDSKACFVKRSQGILVVDDRELRKGLRDLFLGPVFSHDRKS